MNPQHACPFALVVSLTLVSMTVGGCSPSTEHLGQLDEAMTDQPAASGSSRADGPSSPVVSGTECSQRGGVCEHDDGTSLLDPCTATGRPTGAFACGAAEGGANYCCMPKVAASASECEQKGGTCELDDGTLFVDPCTAKSRPIGAFACGAVDGGSNLCCLPN